MVFKKGEKQLPRKSGGPQPGSGRPPTVIDTDKLYELAQTMLPVETIARILDTSIETLYARFSDVLQKGRENRKASLSQVMWHKALVEKDTKMMIWLSKQHLGYKDSMPIEATQINFNVSIIEVPR